jgi:glycosyltransferase involved in cell wall biosynthesis
VQTKRVLVVTSDVPFVEGGHLTIARAAVRALREAGCEADLVRTPQNRFGRQFRAYLATRWTDVEIDGLGRPIDQVISLRFPSYAVKHPVHACWLNHRLREYYDLWPVLRAQLGRKGLVKESLRRFLIHRLDTRLLKRGVTKVFAQSATIQRRLRRWGNIPSDVLYPPPPQRKYRTSGYENMIFSVSRLTPLKRLGLLVEALALVRNSDLRAVIAGDGPERESLGRLVREKGLESRVALLGQVDEETVISHYGRCLAVFFAPRDEDYGFVTPEAFASRKAVITATDSGGPTELVRDGESGFIVPPEPDRIADKLDLLAESRGLAERMGERGFEAIRGLTWPETVRRLLSIGRR